MTKTFVEALASKIDEEAVFERITNEHSDTVDELNSNYDISYPLIRKPHQYIGSERWWQTRDRYRFITGVYSTTSIIDMINCSPMGQYAVHISKEDQSMVAYTPSTEDGMRDKQVRTTLGRFLRKYYLNLRDSEIQDLEQEHKAELSGVFEVATTGDEIAYVYQHMDGDSGCMRREPSYYGIGNGKHPSVAYAAPGIRVAYTKDAEGRIKSRSVIYDNPDDPHDKRYVRIYGAPVLAKLLRRAGYRPKDLIGARLAKVPYVDEAGHEHENTYVVPYLDGAEGNQNSGTGRGTHVVDKGDGYLTVIDANMADSLMRAHPDMCVVSGAKSTSARVSLQTMPSPIWTCAIYGTQHDRTKGEFAVKAYINDAMVEVHEVSARAAGFTRMRYVNSTRNTTMVWFPASTSSFSHMGYTYAELPSIRRALGYMLLDATYYPNGGWEVRQNIVVDHAGRNVSAKDVMDVLPESGSAVLYHKSERSALLKSGYIVMATNGSSRVVLGHKNRAGIVKAKNGRMIDTDYHAGTYVKTWDGKYVHESAVGSWYAYGQYLHYDTSEEGASTLRAEAARDVVLSTASFRRIKATLESVVPTTTTSQSATTVHNTVRSMFATLYSSEHGSMYSVVKDEHGVDQPSTRAHYLNGDSNPMGYIERYVAAVDNASEQVKENYGPSYWHDIEVKATLLKGLLMAYEPIKEQLTQLIYTLEMEEAGQMRLDTLPADIAAQQDDSVNAPVREEETV